MKTKILLKQLEGIQTVKSVMTILNVTKSKAIYYVYRLRREGYVKTRRSSDKTRIYKISFENKLNGISYEEIINKNSPIKIAISKIYKIYGKEPSSEETLIYAIKTKSLRTILAAIGLFREIDDWKKLYHVAKENHIERQVGALYDLARKVMRTRRMSKKFRNNALPREGHEFRYIIPGLKSKNFGDIEKKWKIYLPFNKQDLEVYL